MKSPLRRRISSPVPYVLEYTNADGTKISETFKLSYDFNSLALVEETLGISMLLDIGAVLDNPSVKNVSVLLWAALQEYHPEYEGEEGLRIVRSNLTMASAKDARVACTKAFIKQLPPDEVARIEAAAASEVPVPLAESPTVSD